MTQFTEYAAAVDALRQEHRISWRGVKLMALLMETDNAGVYLSETGRPSWLAVLGPNANPDLFSKEYGARGKGESGWCSWIKLTPLGIRAAQALAPQIKMRPLRMVKAAGGRR